MDTEEKSNKDDPRQDGPERPKNKGEKCYRESIREGREKAGPGNRYYFTAMKHRRPMMFRRYEGQDILGTILKDGGYTFTGFSKGGSSSLVAMTSSWNCLQDDRGGVSSCGVSA